MKHLTLFILLTFALSFHSCVKEDLPGPIISYYITTSASEDISTVALDDFRLRIQTKELEGKPYIDVNSFDDLLFNPQEEEQEIFIGEVQLPEGLLNTHRLRINPRNEFTVGGEVKRIKIENNTIVAGEDFPLIEVEMKSLERYKITFELNLQDSRLTKENDWYLFDPVFTSIVEKLK